LASAQHTPTPISGTRVHEGTGARRALAGFLVSGVFLSFLGAILPAWGYHLVPDLSGAGSYFLFLNAGILLSIPVGERLRRRKGTAFLMSLGSGTGCGAFLLLALASPPAASLFRLAGLLVLGAGAGLLNVGLFHAISPLYRQNRAATVNLAGTLFGAGCLAGTLLIFGAYYVYNVASTLVLLAVIPGLFAGFFLKGQFPPPEPAENFSLRAVQSEFRTPGAVLFTLLLFFQFGNEWSVAGWLPLFLTRRIGMSPANSLLMLAAFWFALTVGRLISQGLLRSVSHGRLLMASVAAAFLGFAVLSSTDNRFGAIVGIISVGCGFAAIYPLVVEKIGHRFPHYHPGFYNGIFSFATTGGLLAPWLLGYLAQAWGIRVIMVVPLLGTFLVFLLLLLILLESTLSEGQMVKGVRNPLR
jgi:fucose permease